MVCNQIICNFIAISKHRIHLQCQTIYDILHFYYGAFGV